MPKESPVTFRAKVITPISQPSPGIVKWFKHFNSETAPAIAELLLSTIHDLAPVEHQLKNLRIAIQKSRKPKGRRFSWQQTTNMVWSVDITLTNFKAEMTGGRSMPLVERIEAHKQIACERFAEVIASIFVASQIARPGVLRIKELELWVDGSFLKKTDGIFGFWGEVVEFAGEKSWPKIEALSIKDVWQWMCSFDSLAGNLGKTSVGRALNAATHLVTRKAGEGNDLIDLMWAMVGLEALYGRGTADLTYQLVEKTKVFLGHSDGFEKSVKEMYRFRSLFIHGKASFPGALFTWDGMPEYDRFADESGDAAFLASAVLIASLQQLVKRNWKEISFSFVADDPPHNA
jgi:hypothetical protein